MLISNYLLVALMTKLALSPFHEGCYEVGRNGKQFENVSKEFNHAASLPQVEPCIEGEAVVQCPQQGQRVRL